MTVVTTIDVKGMTPEEYRRVMDALGVEAEPEPGIYLHVTIQTGFGYRVVEIWDSEAGFSAFMEGRLGPAAAQAGIEREMTVSIEPLHNLFAPRLDELPGLVAGLAGARPPSAAA